MGGERPDAPDGCATHVGDVVRSKAARPRTVRASATRAVTTSAGKRLFAASSQGDSSRNSRHPCRLRADETKEIAVKCVRPALCSVMLAIALAVCVSGGAARRATPSPAPAAKGTGTRSQAVRLCRRRFLPTARRTSAAWPGKRRLGSYITNMGSVSSKPTATAMERRPGGARTAGWRAGRTIGWRRRDLGWRTRWREG